MVAIKDMLGEQTVIRADGRKVDELRPVRITRRFTDVPEGSVLIECGNTRVMCTATFTSGVPRWRKDSGLGWVTAEYAMLDLPYIEDSQAMTDMNVAMTGSGEFIEIQGTAEHRPFSRAELNALLDLAEQGNKELQAAQRAALALD